MRVLITGIRDFVDPRVIGQAVADSGFLVTTVLTGSFYGVEQQVAAWAAKVDLPVVRYKPDWIRNRLQAPRIRSETLLDDADAVIVIWTGNDAAKYFVDGARLRRKAVHVHHV